MHAQRVGRRRSALRCTQNDEKSWRWPFSLDWTWIIRGDVKLFNDDRFQGVTPPPGFVQPSARPGYTMKGYVPRPPKGYVPSASVRV